MGGQDIIRYSPIFRECVREFLLSSIEDGISYVEARINFLFKWVLPFIPSHALASIFRDRTFIGPDGQTTLTHSDVLRIYGSVVQEVKDEMKRGGREDEFIGSKVLYIVLTRVSRPLCPNPRLLKIIYCTIKVITPEELELDTEDCLALKMEFPHLIAGSYDIFVSALSMNPNGILLNRVRPGRSGRC